LKRLSRFASKASLVFVLGLPVWPALLTGCGTRETPKTEDPDAVEKMRKSYEDMSHRERQGTPE
jgi:hypothetical protein